MAKSQKVTITLEPRVLHEVDRTRLAAGTTRSRFVAHAIDAYLQRLSENVAEEVWAHSYETVPQQVSSESLELLDSLSSEDW